MATIYFGISRGEKNVTRDTSTTSKEVEVVFSDALSPTLRKDQIVNALRRIEEAILEDTNHNDI